MIRDERKRQESSQEGRQFVEQLLNLELMKKRLRPAVEKRECLVNLFSLKDKPILIKRCRGKRRDDD